MTPAGAGHGRLIFAMDATMSRQPTWDLALELQADMFHAVKEVGGLDVQLVYFRGFSEMPGQQMGRRSGRARQADVRGHCQGGLTQIRKVLSHARRESEKAQGQCGGLCRRLHGGGDRRAQPPRRRARPLGVPVFLFQEGREPRPSAPLRRSPGSPAALIAGSMRARRGSFASCSRRSRSMRPADARRFKTSARRRRATPRLRLLEQLGGDRSAPNSPATLYSLPFFLAGVALLLVSDLWRTLASLAANPSNACSVIRKTGRHRRSCRSRIPVTRGLGALPSLSPCSDSLWSVAAVGSWYAEARSASRRASPPDRHRAFAPTDSRWSSTTISGAWREAADGAVRRTATLSSLSDRGAFELLDELQSEGAQECAPDRGLSRLAPRPAGATRR